MKNVLFLLLPLFANSQTEKGINPLPAAAAGAGLRPVTYAVVVGISDYQEAAIPDLRFADKDAEAFANFLRSPAGGSLDEDHLKLLTNSAATTAQFDAALGWLIDESKEGDQAIIYFSGHGDVETKTRSQQGFLLCWDSPPQAYISGAYPVFFLKEVVSTLSMENKARVIVITDACRSGKLAGNTIGGSQLTSQNLAQQFANEIKILSCQPNEYSIEGEQWGGGRGAFSFHLLDGLYGLADGNSDASVNLLEISRYLEDKVTTEVAPHSQIPMTIGNRTEKLTSVFPELLEALRKGKAGQMPIFSGTDSKGIEEDVLATVDTTVREYYRLFKKALKEKVFLEPADACADAYYGRLIAAPKLERLHNSMRRNYAAALQDEAQQEMNIMLKTGLSLEVLGKQNRKKDYRNYAIWLGRAAELLGEEHYMYPTLMARKAFFEAKIQKSRSKSRLLYFKALELQPGLPHAYSGLIMTYLAGEADSAVFFAKKAMEISPEWVMPYLDLAKFHSYRQRDFEKVGVLLEKASNLDSNSVVVWYHKANFYYQQENYEKAIYWYKKAIDAYKGDLCFNDAFHHLGNAYIRTQRYEDAENVLLLAVQLDSTFGGTLNRLGKVYWLTGKFKESEEAFKKEIRLSFDEQSKSRAYNELGNLYNEKLGRIPEAKDFYLKSIETDSLNFDPYINISKIFRYEGEFEASEQLLLKLLQLHIRDGLAYMGLAQTYLEMGRPLDAEANMKKGLELDTSFDNVYWYACMLSRLNKKEEALETLGKAFQRGFSDYEWMKDDEDLAPLRALPEWKVLMKKYFPDQVKD